jgi:hypothetical protein
MAISTADCIMTSIWIAMGVRRVGHLGLGWIERRRMVCATVRADVVVGDREQRLARK